MIDPKKIRLTYYDSADGPRVMLFGPMEVDLVALRDCFSQLSKGTSEVALDTEEFIYTSSVRLRLRSVGGMFEVKSGDAQQGLRRDPADARSFTWTRTNEGWDYLAELLNGLIDSSRAGHQYLTRYPDEDAVVLVSKGEYDDKVLAAY